MTEDTASHEWDEQAGPHPVFLRDPATDALVTVCLELAAELWVTRSRLHHLEGLLTVAGRPAGEVLDSKVGKPADAEALAQARDEFVRNIFGSLANLPTS
ncbi:hypothetical protein [Streptomyces sp. NPDC052042]|uniref:hypothetical protein n=1 Tax=Streptomyces sp. NPDC052042 TaxID=3365683 RepID=UPI0037D4E52E